MLSFSALLAAVIGKITSLLTGKVVELEFYGGAAIFAVIAVLVIWFASPLVVKIALGVLVAEVVVLYAAKEGLLPFLPSTPKAK